MDIILVIDFGGQYAHLINRRVRELGVYSEIYLHSIPLEQIQDLHPKGIILSGGPSSVYELGAPNLSSEFFTYITTAQIPLLGLCYGHQLIGQQYHGKVIPHKEKEFGRTVLTILKSRDLFEGLAEHETVWMSHGDQVGELPNGFTLLGQTPTCQIAAMGDFSRHIYGLQFHPEVIHTEHGMSILRNFIFNICKTQASWKVENWIPTTITEIRKIVKEDQVILGLSGGVDSSVLAMLLYQAIGDRVHFIFVNNGLLRKNEVDQVCTLFQQTLHFQNFHLIDAENEFLTNLKGIEDPEKKRQIIGHLFIKIFDETARSLGHQFPNIAFLAQGTIYPDRVESQAGSGGKSSSKIKSHHNLALPENMHLKILEPLRDLYKDEVRVLGRQLGLPEELVTRHPFPGPGLAVRCLGEITKERLNLLREADAIVIEEIKTAGLYSTLWQAFAVFLPVKSVGVMGDFRTYENICALRIVESVDAMTANFARLDWAILDRIATRIINEVRGFNRVVYDISNKPPATIEYE